MPLTLNKWDTASQLKTREDAILFLLACLDEGADDDAFINHACSTVRNSLAFATLSDQDPLRAVLGHNAPTSCKEIQTLVQKLRRTISINLDAAAQI